MSFICLLAYLQDMSIVEAQLLTLKILKQVMEEKLNEQNVQLAQVSPPARLPLALTPSIPVFETDYGYHL